MKLKYYSLITTAFFGISMLLSCSENMNEKMDLLDCDVSLTEFKFDVAPSEVKTVDITSETNWKVVVDQGSVKWLTVSPLEGSGNGRLTITAIKNSGPQRSATIVVSARGAEIKTIDISQQGYSGVIYNFADFKGWQKTGLVPGINPYSFVDSPDCEDGKALRIYTRPGAEFEGINGDRFKVQTTTRYGSGRYEWRVFVPEMGLHDRASIGAFVYFDDTHELDFEIASGTAANRAKYGAAKDEVLCLISSQANPFMGETVPIKSNAWHILVLDLKLVNGKYLGEWLVDGKRIGNAPTQLNFGEEAILRSICSVENLSGMGDHAATQENYALFDYFEYVPYEYSMKPIPDAQRDPEPDGLVKKWLFMTDGVDPEGWVRNSGTIKDGYLNLPNATNITYGEEVFAGKYTWEIDVPKGIGVGEKWLAGGNISATNAEERSFSMFVFPGTDADRKACDIAPVKGQMLVRCYTEKIGVYGVPIDPGKHVLTIDLRLVKNDEGTMVYEPTWIIDGEEVKTVQTWYTPQLFQFAFSMMTFADGGGWQGDKPTSGTHTAKYKFIEYKKYKYD